MKLAVSAEHLVGPRFYKYVSLKNSDSRVYVVRDKAPTFKNETLSQKSNCTHHHHGEMSSGHQETVWQEKKTEWYDWTKQRRRVLLLWSCGLSFSESLGLKAAEMIHTVTFKYRSAVKAGDDKRVRVSLHAEYKRPVNHSGGW